MPQKINKNNKNNQLDNQFTPQSPTKVLLPPTAQSDLNSIGAEKETQKEDYFNDPKIEQAFLEFDNSSISDENNIFQPDTLRKIQEYNVFTKKNIGDSINPVPNKVSKHRNVLKRTIRLFLQGMMDKRKSWYPAETDKEIKKSINKRIKVLKEEVFTEGKKACFSLKNMKTLFSYDEQQDKVLREIFQNILGQEIIPNSLFCPVLNRSKESLKLYLICMKAQRLRCRNRSLILRTQFS